ncbi:MFS transporter [Streptomyces nojiriensis]|uniref:MFS transporter n=1 Tax=Streptomyces nojiriensis TaxID=66374 RepID=UPI0035D9A750
MSGTNAAGVRTPSPWQRLNAASGGTNRWVVLAVLCVSLVLVALDATILHVAVPSVTEDLRPGSIELLWIVDAYPLVCASLLILFGTLGDRVGRRRILLLGYGLFGAASAIAALADNAQVLIAARALLGIGGAMIMPATLSILRQVFPDRRERALAIGIWTAVAAIGAASGPVLGGFLVQHFWWGSVFLINLPVMIALVVVGIKLLPESRNPVAGPWDLVSVGLSLVGVISVVYAVKEVATHGVTWQVAATAALGAGALYAFVRRQFGLPSPLLDMRLFKHRGFSGAVLADLLTVFGLSGLVFFLSQFLQLVQGRDPLEAGLAELPAAIGAVVTGLIAGRYARRYSVRTIVAGGLGAIGLALAVLTLIHKESGYPLLGAALLVVGLGAGFSFTVTADVILSSVPKEQAGSASAVSETAYELGAALGIALLGSIVTGVYQSFTAPASVAGPVADAAHESLGGAVEAAKALDPHTAQVMVGAAQDAFVDGLRLASGVGAAVLLATAVAAWFLLRGQRLQDGVEH